MANNIVKKTYRVGKIYFEIQLESPREGMLTLPVDWKVPSNILNKYFLNISNKDFDDDMLIMIPASFGEDWMEAFFIQFQKRVKKHMEEFKRTLPADLECYVAELILIFDSIGRFINQPLNETERQTFFKKILLDVSSTLNIPVELKFTV